MQRFVRKVVSLAHHHHHHHRQPSLSFTNTHRIFHTSRGSAHIQTPKPSQLGHHIPLSFTTRQVHRFHSWPSSHHHTISSKIRSCLSQPMIALKSPNALRRISLLDCRPRLPALHFSALRFNSNWSYGSYRRGWSSLFDRLTPDNMLLGLIIANAAIFLLWRIADQQFMINNFTISLDNIKSGRLHTLITNAFSHVDPWHIFSNMLGLYFFGMNVGRNFGPGFLLKLYLAGAVGGSVFYLVHQAYKAQSSKGWRSTNRSTELAKGASGAVNAVILLHIFLYPTATIYFDFFIPVPAMMFGAYIIGKDMLRIIQGDTSISGASHLGGATVGAIAWALVRKGRI